MQSIIAPFFNDMREHDVHVTADIVCKAVKGLRETR